MKQNYNFMSVLAGILLGAVLSGPVSHAAETLIIQPSSQKFFLDGTQIQLQAYNINGCNYVRLADICPVLKIDLAYNGATNSVYIGEPPESAVQNEASVVPMDGSRYVPKVGDVIRCDDGTDYIIKDVSRWDANAFADGPLPELPQPTCDWSKMPQVEMPQVELRHFDYGHGDYLFIRNVYESKRMLYTMYNAMGHNPETWSNGEPVLHPSGNQKVRINLTIPDDVEPEHFWPWRDRQIVEPFNAHPCGTHNMEAWDVFKNGVFLRTEYNMYHTIR